MQQVHFARPDTARGRARPRLDLRLATLAELGIEAYGQRPDELERAFAGFRREGPLAFLRGGDRADGLEGGGPPPVAQVFLTVTEPAAFDRIAAALEKQGGRILSRAITVATVHLPLSALCALEDRPDVVAIEWSGAFRPAIGAPERALPLAPRAAMGMEHVPPALDGRGTLIGVVDCGGIDIYHPDFVDCGGRTRLRALWDQRALYSASQDGEGGALPRPRYGRVHDRATLDLELSPRNDRPHSVVPHRAVKGSHGTATAGIAAGLGAERAEARGVAPGAGIVYVDTFGSGAGALGAVTELADAIRFIFDVATADGKPCAVNVSLGDDLGPHDGNSPLERFIDELLSEGSGRAVIVAAGNSAARRRHATVDLGGPGVERSATLELEVGARNRSSVVLEVWYDAAGALDDAAGETAGALDVEIEAPDGGRTGRIGPDGLPRAYDSGATRVLVASTGRAPGGSGAVRVELLAAGDDDIGPGTWKVHLHARGAVREAHAWIDHRYVQFAASRGSDKRITVTSPATASRAISVGAYNVARGKLFWYSGRGPGRDGRPKPDLLAPGGPLVTASASTTRRYTDLSFGTSVAAPLVTGAAALLFQRFGPGLSREDLIAKLTASGRVGPATDGVPVATLAHLAGEAASTFESRQTSLLVPDAQHERVDKMENRKYARPADAVQIWTGEYVLRQGESIVGKLYVEELNGPSHTKEHWVLYSGYQWPSSTYPYKEIIFDYQGAVGDLEEFLDAPPSGSTYIIATCDQQS